MQSQNTVANQKLDIQSKLWFINLAFVQRRYFFSCKWCIWFSLSLFFFFLLMVSQMVKCLPAVWETQGRSLVQEDPLEKEMVTHSRTLAWKIPWTEEPGRLQSMGLQRVGHN